MKRKQPWMRKGNAVMAYGKPGVIVSMQENTIDGVDYVYYIEVRINGTKHSAPYHPNDVEELKGSEVTNAYLTTHGLALKVQAVRNAQRLYFQQIGEARRKQVSVLFTQANATKEISKKLESELDQLVEDVLLAGKQESNKAQVAGLLIGEILTQYKKLADGVDMRDYQQYRETGTLITKLFKNLTGREVEP